MPIYINKLNFVSNSSSFWGTVRSLNRCSLPCNDIKEAEWIKFYKKMMPARKLLEITMYDVTREIDCEFTIDELCAAINHTKNNKVGGPDGTSNELFKNLPAGGKLYLLAVYNNLWRHEIVPEDWYQSITAMLFKKGDRSDPVNYRPISLLNCPLKIFTQMLHNRLYKWSEDSNILPESQAGFRKSRSCHENVFTLKAAVDVRLRKKNRKLFAFFIDFSRAFPSIPHDKLWNKLFEIGVSAKIIRWLKTLYENSTMQIRLNNDCLSSPIDITEGVLQGEILSPLLFNLYISEVEKTLRNSEGVGVNISTTEQLHMLAYADDMVILSESAYGMKRKIEALEIYFKDLSLSVNIDKTKILIFQRGGRISRNVHFSYNGKAIDIVKNYTYLGVIFSASGKFAKASQGFKENGLKAIGAIWNVLLKGRMHSWDSFLKLFEATIKPTAMYCSDIWAPRYLHTLERVQGFYFKKLLALSRQTPDTIVRLETGIAHLELNVAKQLLESWRRYALLPKSRYASKYLVRLIELCNRKEINDSWINYLDHILQRFSTTLTINSNIGEISNTRWNALSQSILVKIKNCLWDLDFEWLNKHDKFHDYISLLPKRHFPASHLNLDMSLVKKRLISQCRTNSSYVRINNINIPMNANCIICDCEKDCPHHVLFSCSVHSASRFFLNAVKQYPVDIKLLQIKNYEQAIAVLSFIKSCYNRRQLAL